MVSKALLIFLAALCAVAVAEEESMVGIFKTDVTEAAEKVKEISEHISKMLGLDNLPSGTEIIEIVKTHTKNFADQAEQIQKELEEKIPQLNNSSIVESFGELNKKLQDTVASFRSQLENSEVEQKAAELQGQFQNAINAIVDQSKTIAQNLEPQVTEAGKDLEKVTKKLLDNAIENLNQLEGKLHTATGHNTAAASN